MRKNSIKIALLVLFGITTMAMNGQIKITGTVVDEDDKPVEFAAVRIEGTMLGVNTDLNGRYEITVPEKDTINVVFSCIGYSDVKRRIIKPVSPVNISPKLYKKTIELQEVQVTEYKKQTNTMQSIDIEVAKMTPSASGNTVENVITTQAGVSSKNEMSAQYMVRGGTYDENSVYINGIEVYRPQLVTNGQQEGLSIINGDMVQKVDFSTGGFNAEYSDKMSSVLDITYKEPQAFEGSLSASLQGGTLALGHRWSRKASTTLSSLTIKPSSPSSPARSSRSHCLATCRSTTTASLLPTARRALAHRPMPSRSSSISTVRRKTSSTPTLARCR